MLPSGKNNIAALSGTPASITVSTTTQIEPPIVIQRLPSPRVTKTVVEKATPVLSKLPSTNNYVSFITSSNCENELNKAGYTVSNKIITRDEKSNILVSFVKAVDRNGNNVYVLIDDSGYLSTTRSDVELTRTSTNLLPFSVKNGSYESVGIEGAGVALECGSSGICTMIRGSDMAPVESNYLARGVIDVQKERVYSYPIVKLSEIKHHPDLIEKNVQNVCYRIRNQSMQKSMEELREFKRLSDELCVKLSEFDALRIKVTNCWNNALRQIESSSLSMEDSRNKYNQLNGHAESLVTAIDAVTAHNTSMRSIVESIHSLNGSVEMKFESIMR